MSQSCDDISIRLDIIRDIFSISARLSVCVSPGASIMSKRMDRQTDGQTSGNTKNIAFCVQCMLTCDNYAYKAKRNIRLTCVLLLYLDFVLGIISNKTLFLMTLVYK